jgi:hypothetical protein
MSTAIFLHDSGPVVPALDAGAGDRARRCFLEFFTVNIRNRNTGRHTLAPPPCFSAGVNGRKLPGCRTRSRCTRPLISSRRRKKKQRSSLPNFALN